MSQKERAEKFLEELTELSRKYGFKIVAEGSPTLLKDGIEGGWVEFGAGWLSGKYEIYED
jgi:hypothetical protein